MSTVDVIQAPFSPLRAAVLGALRSPASATEVAAQLGETRQRVNYHVRSLEKAGLVELVEERPRRGCTERIMRATCGALVVEPQVVGEVPDAQDRFAADTVLEGGARLVRDVAAARSAAAARGQRLLTFAIDAEVGFERPADVERFTDALAEAVAATVAQFGGPRRYRLFLGGIPA
jgi:DNA-binding transcriptional ArsR family regulator